jgi:type IV pilus assembly protein PilA
MMSTLRQRLRNDQGGFTLIELLVVIIIIGILLAIAVPSYLAFKEKAEKSAAQANVRSAIPAAEAYYSDNGNYTGITAAGLKSTYDAGLNLEAATAPTASTYCLSSVKGGHRAKVTGPGGTITVGTTTAVTACS